MKVSDGDGGAGYQEWQKSRYREKRNSSSIDRKETEEALPIFKFLFLLLYFEWLRTFKSWLYLNLLIPVQRLIECERIYTNV